MKSKAILVSFLVLFVMALVLQTVSASEFVKITRVEFDNSVLDQNTVIGIDVSRTIPVEVTFVANRYATDVRVEIELEAGGFRDEISDKTSRFVINEGRTYTKRFTLQMPPTVEFDDELLKDLALGIEITAEDESTVRNDFMLELTVQREQYNLNFLSVDLTDEVVPGNTVAIDVVLENNGFEDLDNVYIEAAIPELGIQRKIYAGNIDELDERDFECEVDCDNLNRRDTVNKRLYLTIPRDTVPGIYDVNIEAYNYDTAVSTQSRVVVSGIETGVLPSITARAIEIGEETTFEVVLVNPNDRMVVYTITPEESKGLIVEITEPIITVPADSSKTVKVRVKATESADEGTHLVTVNVNSESELVKQVNFTLNVENATKIGTTNAIVVLTIVLVIIFVVLLIVLIVLITKKPAETEEFEKNIYY